MKDADEAVLSLFSSFDPAERVFLGGHQLDDVLADRDNPAFDGPWMQHYQAISEVVRAAELDPAVNRVQERVFKAIFAAHGNPELAGEVSDDIAFLVAHARMRTATPWVARMLEEYSAGRFPRGQLVGTTRTFDDILSRYR